MSGTGNGENDAETTVPDHEAEPNRESAYEKPANDDSGDVSAPDRRLFDLDSLESQQRKLNLLNSELSAILADIHLQVKTAVDRMKIIQSVIDQKKEELKALHGIEASAVSLRELIENQRSQKEMIERLMEDRNRIWEEEKERLAEEERDYRRKIEIERQREAEIHARRTEEERQEARRNFYAELQEARQTAEEKWNMAERECSRREQALKEREFESARLMEELERFMVRLSLRFGSGAEEFSSGRDIDNAHEPECGESEPPSRFAS
ncbi:MAG TPA: hypothetical protein VLL97_04780 [Acidobacteriota bacterium]|nr:hypothetical protein [Acidobacteriota bacterium]